jgi:hypothetical protein
MGTPTNKYVGGIQIPPQILIFILLGMKRTKGFNNTTIDNENDIMQKSTP